ncbi:hypothetical protein [Paludisphaera soli]|uniref:hypothetical protein n=1 Tax=Paludisphaera soli TaxID=2712865 RepID=UPI0013EB2FB5|nr:hypothetical protein [Paludisphaera soli]
MTSIQADGRFRSGGEGHWLAALGFELVHEPGISRAWRLDLAGGYLLITDVGGYDLPEVGAAASAYRFTRGDELEEFVEVLLDARSLHAWIRRARRRAGWRSRGSPRRDGG